MLRVHYFQHVAFEGLGSIEPYLLARGHALSGTHWYRGEPLPDMQAVDVLMVMGAPWAFMITLTMLGCYPKRN